MKIYCVYTNSSRAASVEPKELLDEAEAGEGAGGGGGGDAAISEGRGGGRCRCLL